MAEHRTLNPQVEGSIPSAPIRAISHEVALFFCPPPAAQALALFRLRSIRARFALFRLRSIRALRRLCARACALARIRRRLRPFRPIPLALHTGSIRLRHCAGAQTPRPQRPGYPRQSKAHIISPLPNSIPVFLMHTYIDLF